MKVRRRRSVIAALLAAGVLGALAIGASSASAQPGVVPFFAYLDEGQEKTLVGVPGAAVGAECQSTNEEVVLALAGTASNGLAKATWSDEGNNTATFSRDDLDTGELMPMNDAGTGREVTGHMEFVNGSGSRNLTAQYSTEDGADFSAALGDCAVWGSAIKEILG
jgi:hypothetical protein